MRGLFLSDGRTDGERSWRRRQDHEGVCVGLRTDGRSVVDWPEEGGQRTREGKGREVVGKKRLLFFVLS